MHNENTSVPSCTEITQVTTKEVHNLGQVEEQIPCPDYGYSGQEYHTPEQETVPTHPVENNDEEEGISEKNRQASQDKEAQVAHSDDSKKDQEEEDDEKEDHEENNGNREADKEDDEEDDEEDRIKKLRLLIQLVMMQNKQVLYSNPTQLDKEGLSTGKLNAFHAAPSKQQDKPVDPEEFAMQEKEVLFLYQRLHKVFLLPNQVSKEEEMKSISRFMQKLDSYHNLPASIIHSIKIKKVLSHILKLNSIPKDKEYNFCGCTLNILTKFTAITRQKNNEDLDLCHIETNKEHSLPNQGDSCQMDKDVCINADKDCILPCEDGSKLRDENGDKNGYCTSSNPDESQLREAGNEDECYTTSNTDDSQLGDENAHTDTDKDCTLPCKGGSKLRDENRNIGNLFLS
ncbi:hypothetical protein FQN51_002898 [Onygenales sp. PD_10]|nr:hypothetical protein FQN51_002898 [Onygenales sp. PD_10]